MPIVMITRSAYIKDVVLIKPIYYSDSIPHICVDWFSFPIWRVKMAATLHPQTLSINDIYWNSATSFKILNHSLVVTWGTAAPLYQCSVHRWQVMDFRAVLFPSPDCRDCLGMLAGPWQARPPPCLTLINIQRCPLNPSWAVTTRPILGFLYHIGWCGCCCKLLVVMMTVIMM